MIKKLSKLNRELRSSKVRIKNTTYVLSNKPKWVDTSNLYGETAEEAKKRRRGRKS